MNEVQEKDTFWVWVGALVVAIIAVVIMIKGSEHGKYESTAKAIAEDSANSAYRNDVIHQGGKQQ